MNLKNIALWGSWKPGLAGLFFGALIGGFASPSSSDGAVITISSLAYAGLSGFSWYNILSYADTFAMARTTTGEKVVRLFWVSWSIVTTLMFVGSLIVSVVGGAIGLIYFFFLLAGAPAWLLKGTEFVVKHQLEQEARALVIQSDVEFNPTDHKKMESKEKERETQRSYGEYPTRKQNVDDEGRPIID